MRQERRKTPQKMAEALRWVGCNAYVMKEAKAGGGAEACGRCGVVGEVSTSDIVDVVAALLRMEESGRRVSHKRVR